MVLNVCEVAACVHASETLSLKKQVGCFNHGVGTLVASKLKRQRLWEAAFVKTPSQCIVVVRIRALAFLTTA